MKDEIEQYKDYLKDKLAKLLEELKKPITSLPLTTGYNYIHYNKKYNNYRVRIKKLNASKYFKKLQDAIAYRNYVQEKNDVN